MFFKRLILLQTVTSLCIARNTEGVGRVNIRSMSGKYSKLSEVTM
jgi:hypothetical protein